MYPTPDQTTAALECNNTTTHRLLPAEVFNDKECPHDDVWPCKEAAVEGARALWSPPGGAPDGSPARLQV